VFDAQGVSFVAVTQQFNTTTSMGRLTLNVLLSFAQFEREVTGERIRDKIAASKRKGMWMGGVASLGYDIRDRRLVMNRTEAATVRQIFERYLEFGSVRLLKEDLDRRGIVSKIRMSKSGTRSGGRCFSRGALYKLLTNPIYIGEIRHRKERHPGQHEPIVDRGLWEGTQRQLCDHAAHRREKPVRTLPSPLAGKLFDKDGAPLYVCGTTKGQQRYRYYVSRKLIRGSAIRAEDGWRLAAPEIERSVAIATRQIVKDQASISTALQEGGISTMELSFALKIVEDCCAQLEAHSEIATTISEAIERVDLSKDGIQLTLNLAPLISHQVSVPVGARLTITRLVPLQIKRRGVELRLVLKGEATAVRRTDPALLKAVSRGHRWFAELASGRAASTIELAKREGLNDSYVRRLVRLKFLSPTIIEAICAGWQPADLTAQKLTRGSDVPLGWCDQQRAIGIE
jgi:site-specific DNA recombinase